MQCYNLFICICVGAVLTSTAIEPLGYFPLSWIGLAPLWLGILRFPKSRKKICLYSISWGCIFYGISLFWITNFHPLTWMGVSWLPSLLFAISYWFVVSSVGGIFLAIWGLGLQFVVVRKYGLFTQILTAASLWSCLELFFQSTPFWWISLALTQSPSNLWVLQLNTISGSSTIVILIVAVNGLIANLVHTDSQEQKFQLSKIILGIIFISHLFGVLIYYLPDKKLDNSKIAIGIVQGDIPHETKFEPEGIDLAIKRYSQGYRRLIGKSVDGVLSPELAIPGLGQHPNIQDTDFFAQIKKHRKPLWIGTRTGDEENPKQSLIALEGNGLTAQYDKQKMVLFGETIPFFDTFLEPSIRKLFPFGMHHQIGNKKQIFNTPYGKAVVAICYESAYPQIFLSQVRTGGRFILVATADGLFGRNMMQQHHAQDVLRAIETGRWLVRANSRDYSGVIDSKGNTEWISKPGYLIHKADIYSSDRKTIYVCFGNWITFVLIILSVYYVVVRNQRY